MMNFSDYVELEKRADAHGIVDDPALAQLLHINVQRCRISHPQAEG